MTDKIKVMIANDQKEVKIPTGVRMPRAPLLSCGFGAGEF